MKQRLQSIVARFQALVDRIAEGPVGALLRPLMLRARSYRLMSSANRFVLTLGDDGATLVTIRHNSVTDALFVAIDAEDGLATVREALAADPLAQLIVSADVLEQMYREEKLPKVGRWDRLTITRRRLDVAFPHDKLKASVPIGQDSGATNSCTFMALPATPLIEQWIGFLEALPNPIVGFCLLPLESEQIGAKLAGTPSEEGGKVWNALVTQQATSGFRQIFESGGNLVVTRLTQRPPGDMTPEAVAQLIERELRSSISYVKRLGYSEQDRLQLVVLGSQAVCAAVAERSLPVSALKVMTPREAGERLGFGAIGPEDSPYSDVLHAVNLAHKRRPKAVLPTELLAERTMVDKLFRASFAVAAVVVLVTILNLGGLLLDGYQTVLTARTLQRSIETERQVLNSFKTKTTEFDLPLDQLVDATQAETAMAKEQVDVAGLIEKLALVLDDKMSVEKIAFNALPAAFLGDVVGAAPAPARGPKRNLEGNFELHVFLKFAGQTAAQERQAVQLAKQMREKLATVFPEADVTVSQLPFANLKVESVQGTVTGNSQVPVAEEPAITEYLIKKKS